MKQRSKKSRIFRVISTLLLTPIILIGVAGALLYFPPIQNFAVKKACAAVADNSNFSLSMGSFHLSFPLKIDVTDFILSQDGDTLLAGEKFGVNVHIAALLKGKIEINYISIDQTKIYTGGLIDGMTIDGKIGHFRTVVRNIDLLQETADVRQLHLSDTHADILIGPDSEESDTTASSLNWIVQLRRGNISNLKINLSFPQDTATLATEIERFSVRNINADFGNEGYSLQKMSLHNAAIDYDRGTLSDTVAPLHHLRLRKINIETGILDYSRPTINAQISRLTLQQPDGININEGELSLTADSANIRLHRLTLASKNGSALSADGTIPWLTIDNGNRGNAKGELNIFLNKNDLRKILPTATYAQMGILPDSLLELQATLHGNANQLTLDTLQATIPLHARISSSGKIANLNDSKKMSGRLSLNAYVSDIHRALHNAARPDSVAKRRMHLLGTLTADGSEYSATAELFSEWSYASVEARYNSDRDNYSVDAAVKNIDTEGILPNIPLQTLTGRATLAGTGTNIMSNATQYDCKIFIDTVKYDGRKLQNIRLQARQEGKVVRIHTRTDNPALQMSAAAIATLDSAKTTASMQLQVKKADLEYFGITETPIEAQFTLEANGYTDLNESHGLSIKGDKFKLLTPTRTFTPARLDFNGETSPDTSFVKITTGDLAINGTLSSGYAALQKSIETVTKLYTHTAERNDTVHFIQDFEKELPAATLSINCGQNNILTNYLLFNNIKFSGFNLQCSLDSVRGINAQGGLYNLQKDEFTLDTIRLSVRQTGNAIRYFAGMRTKSTDPQRKKLTFTAALFGNLKNDSLRSNFIFRDNRDNVAAKIGLNTRLHPDGFSFKFDRDVTLLNNRFRFNRDNYFDIFKNGRMQGEIELKDSLGTGMRLYTPTDSTTLRNISLELFKIDLQAVTKLLPFAPEMSGIINADVHYSEDGKRTFVSSDIYGSGISYEGTLLGDETIELTYIPEDADRHFVDIAAYHYDKKILSANGIFQDDETHPTLNGSLTLNRFPLQLSNALVKESGLKLDGYIDGELAVKGAVDNSRTNGYIRFDSVYADAPLLNTRLHLADSKVSISDNKLLFNNFDIHAKGDNPFKINGTVDLRNLIDPAFNLRMRATNYELINTTRKKGTMLYGRMFLDLNGNIGGTLSNMNMTGSATLLGKSDITYVMLYSPLATENEFDNLVEFVNFADSTAVASDEEQDINLGNMDINMTLKIEEGARINADFDENRNSYIELQGEGNLNLTYSSEAGMNLTGRYTLSNGQMKYNLPAVPLKTFSISDGSYINWTGDILNPTLHITAQERLTPSVTLEDGTQQSVAFDVGVILTNTLSNMGVSFTLAAPDNAAVQNELNALDPETMNKYAVTMLITGAYLGSKDGITVSNAISSFLDAQINDIAGNAMKSVNINFGIADIENNETGETYKNYSFSFTKRFWKDRLKVIIGGEINDSEHNATQDESFINNISLEWKVSESGNRYIRLFYDKNYESILEGEITETGVGYVYKRKLNSLSELLIFRKKKNSEEPIDPTEKEKTE